VKLGESKLVGWDDLCMEIISNLSQDQILRAAKALKKGHLVAFPTETVYGLGADAGNEHAVSKIYSIKGRPVDHPLIVHISSANQLDKWAIRIPEYAKKLASRFWPGPMTLILKKNDLAKNFVTGGQETVGIRVPNHPIALALLKEFEKLEGTGVAAPSANKFSAVSPTTCSAVVEEIGDCLGNEDLVLDGLQSEIGLESTIIDCTNLKPVVLRPGYITYEQVEFVTQLKIDSTASNIKVSGNLKLHYSPKAKVVLDSIAQFGDGFVAMASIPTPLGAVRLASPETVEDFARDLYQALRLGDQKKLDKIIVMQPTGIGIAIAIRDRLFKASHKFS
jgi:L-threonylcarbamoyladenylate synthase